MLFSLKIK